MKKKNVIAGLGEIGKPIYLIISKNFPTYGYDLDPSRINKKKNLLVEKYETSFLHICIPFSENFISNCVSLSKKFLPEIIVIHSTIAPLTTQKIQQLVDIPVIYSATRGVHMRMLSDLRRYSKFFAVEPKIPNKKWATNEFIKLMKRCGVKTKMMTNPLTLEVAKIVTDTSYYGWLINYAQLSNMIALKYGINYDEMWAFSDEIHKFLGNRPKMFPGFIGGHCVIPNLSLINDESLWQIDKINNMYSKKVKNIESITKKYSKGKNSHKK